MKKYTLALICLIAAALYASAETHYKPHIWIGGRAGVSMAQMSLSPSVKQAWNNGTTGAFTVRYSEEKIFGIIAELGWSQRGWKEDFEEHPFNYSRSLTYIDLPILTHIYFGSRRFKCFFNLGPQFSYLIGNSSSSNFDYEHPNTVPDFPANRQTEQLWAEVHNKFDYGICVGFGCEFYVQPKHSIVLEARYYYGLGNIFPASKADTFSASRNMSIAVSLGYNFRLK